MAVRTQDRSAGLDAVRVLGVLAIVAGHVWETGEPGRLIYAWHVPVFFFLSGWLWTPGRSVGREVSNRVRSLLVPYVAWLVIITVVVAVRDVVDGNSSALSDLVRNAVWGGTHLQRPFNAFWFVTALFATCVVLRVLERATSMQVATVFAVALWLVSYPVSGTLARTPESVGMVLPCLVFLVAGYWARRAVVRLPVQPAVGVVLIAVGLGAASLDSVHIVNLKSGDLGTPVLAYLVAAAVSLGLVLMSQLVDRLAAPTRAAIVSLAAVAFTVVLTHAVVLWALDTPSSGRLLGFLAAVVVPWVLALVLYRTPLSTYLVGPGAARPRRERVAEPA